VVPFLYRRLMRHGGTDKVLVYSQIMSGRKKKKDPRPVFDSIRKPTAPPSQKMGKDKPDERVHPSGRKAKYKKKDVEDQ
jgi:hypothetical protein